MRDAEGAGRSVSRDADDDTSRDGNATPTVSEADRGTEVTHARSGSEGQPPPEAGEEIYYCDLCGNVMLNLHCKLICERCGYRRDCSDP